MNHDQALEEAASEIVADWRDRTPLLRETISAEARRVARAYLEARAECDCTVKGFHRTDCRSIPGVTDAKRLLADFGVTRDT